MRHTMELKKIDERRSLVLIVTTDKRQKTAEGRKTFVVCSYYNPEMPVGAQWTWGHYFDDLWEAVEYAKKA